VETEFLLILERRPGLGDELGVVWAGHGRVELHKPLPRRLLIGLQFFVRLLEPRKCLFRLDPQLLLDAGRRIFPERRRERVAADRLVLLELAGRHKQVRTDRIEGQRTGISRQVAHVDLDTEQVVERVLIFPAVEPPHGDPAPLVGEQFPSRHHRRGQVIQEISLRRPVWLRLILRGHVARVQNVQHLLPSLRRSDGIDHKRQVIHPHARFLRVGPMAPLTVGLEQLLMPGVHDRLRSRGSGRHGKEPAGRNNRTAGKQLHAHCVGLDPTIIGPRHGRQPTRTRLFPAQVRQQ
jgi:hypothetical protein